MRRILKVRRILNSCYLSFLFIIIIFSYCTSFQQEISYPYHYLNILSFHGQDTGDSEQITHSSRNFDNLTLRKVKQSRVDHETIMIDGNQDFHLQASLEGWDQNSTLDGSASHPYLIENYLIQASTQNLIDIKNTSIHFKINNCYLNGDSKIVYGIKFSNVSNGAIENTEIILCSSAVFFTFSNGNIIKDNEMRSSYSGISLSSSMNNQISNNWMYLNINFGIALMANSDSNTIISNAIDRNPLGFTIQNSSHNLISGNNIYAGEGGISLTSNSSSNLVKTNVLEDNGFGILVSSCNFSSIANNIITRCREEGIITERSEHITFFQNNITNSRTGLMIMNSVNINISENFISYNTNDGIEIGYNSFFNNIKKNLISSNSANGVYLNGISETEYNSIIYNSFLENTACGVVIQFSDNNIVQWNNFLGNNWGETQALNGGTNNTFSYNFWDNWISPDDNSDGYTDVPYSFGSVYDPYPLFLPNIQSPYVPHFILEPEFIRPEPDATLNATTIVEWSAAIDSERHKISYSLYYSTDKGKSWIFIASDIDSTSYLWKTSSLPPSSNVRLKLIATCSLGLEVEVFSPGVYYTSPLDLTVPLISLGVLGLIISIISWKGRYKIKESISTLRYGTGVMVDLRKGKAISLKSLTTELICSELDVPRRVKNTLGDDIKTKSVVLRSGLLMLEETPPPTAIGQICGGKVIGDTYFQCKDCLRYVCTPHYADLQKTGSSTCPNCKGTLMSFPFSCNACELDFSGISDLPKESGLCPLCGYALPTQRQLINERLKNISPSIRLAPEYDEMKEMKKKS